MRFKRLMRMKSRSEFLRVRNEGRTFSGKYLVLGVLADQEIIPKMKFGIILTRKIGNAVIRNRVRRRLRGIINCWGDSLDFSGYLVMIPRYMAPDATFQDLESDWKKLTLRAGIVAEDKFL
ncbi:MAG: ribonuclease P protein component [Verrucomicrobiaceae bacterium]|nr:ribonuclease P protein component [Verrucomicrobiaceae bacterium]